MLIFLQEMMNYPLFDPLSVNVIDHTHFIDAAKIPSSVAGLYMFAPRTYQSINTAVVDSLSPMGKLLHNGSSSLAVTVHKTLVGKIAPAVESFKDIVELPDPIAGGGPQLFHESTLMNNKPLVPKQVLTGSLNVTSYTTTYLGTGNLYPSISGNYATAHDTPASLNNQIATSVCLSSIDAFYRSKYTPFSFNGKLFFPDKFLRSIKIDASATGITQATLLQLQGVVEQSNTDNRFNVSASDLVIFVDSLNYESYLTSIEKNPRFSFQMVDHPFTFKQGAGEDMFRNKMWQITPPQAIVDDRTGITLVKITDYSVIPYGTTGATQNKPIFAVYIKNCESYVTQPFTDLNIGAPDLSSKTDMRLSLYGVPVPPLSYSMYKSQNINGTAGAASWLAGWHFGMIYSHVPYPIFIVGQPTSSVDAGRGWRYNFDETGIITGAVPAISVAFSAPVSQPSSTPNPAPKTPTVTK